MSIHHKLSLFYYMLLDFEAPSGQQAASEIFATESGMPSNYQIFMSGLWYLDRQDFSVRRRGPIDRPKLTALRAQKALEYIAHPSLIPDFADDIIIALIRHAPDGDESLALSYFYTVQPILKTSLALELLVGAMARTSISEALLFSRTHSEHTRQLLFQLVLRTALSGEHNGQASSSAGELASLHFDSTEEAWFEEYLLSGEGKSFKKAKEMLLIRKIGRDEFADVGRLKIGGPWAPIVQGIRRGIEGHTE